MSKYKGMALLHRICCIFLLTLFLSAAVSCNLSNPEGEPRPGDADYIPPGWSAPSLAYDRSAYTASRVVESLTRQAPGQFADNSGFAIESNIQKVLGFPSGGGLYSADNSSVASLGMAGGSVVFEFDPPIENHPENLGGYEFIVYGNTFLSGGKPNMEPGVIRVMADENDNGEADDTWYLIPGSHIVNPFTSGSVTYTISEAATEGTVSWVTDPSTITNGSADSHTYQLTNPWWPQGLASPEVFTHLFLLPDTLYSGTSDLASVWGYADTAPTMLLGDLDGNGDTRGVDDYPSIDPVYFYTTPDTHGDNIIDPGSGGGSAIDISWAVDPSDFSPANLTSITWIEIRSASLLTDSLLGESSCEIDALVRVRRQ